MDTDEVKVGYPSMWELLEDLQDMGESNAVIGRYDHTHRAAVAITHRGLSRRSQISRDTLAAASAIYKGVCFSSPTVRRADRYLKKCTVTRMGLFLQHSR